MVRWWRAYVVSELVLDVARLVMAGAVVSGLAWWLSSVVVSHGFGS